MSDLTPPRFNERTTDEEKRASSAIPVVAFFVNSHRFLVDKKIQAILFYADMVHYDERGEQLTDVIWRPYMHGFYSEDVQIAIEEMIAPKAETKKTMWRGIVKTAYMDVPGIDIDADRTTFLESIDEDVQGRSLKELIEWHKGTKLFEITRYDEPASFSALDQYR